VAREHAADAEQSGGTDSRERSLANRLRIGDQLRRLPWGSLAILVFFVFVVAFAGLISPYGPQEMNLSHRFKPPGWEEAGRRYLLGTDPFGRDVLSRLFHGARISLVVAGVTLLFGGGLGLAIGIVAGYVGGKTDAVLMRLTDTFMALPALLVALVFVMTLGPGLTTVVAALSILTWARFTRVIRSEVLSLKESEFVLQAKVAGCSSPRIMVVHILPNVLNTFMIICSLQVARNILTEASLSFLGAGIPAPIPTWGNMVSDGRAYITSAWWICAFPGMALTLVVLSFSLFGDWLRDRLDPKLRQL
jgi:peptide/nickel transport system permease protein